jgi:hypothetical protein
MKRSHRVLMVLMAVLLPFLGLEIWARSTDEPRSDRRKLMDRVLEELPNKEQFLSDRAKAEVFPRMVYADYYLARPKPLKTETINYLEDFYSARPCPDSSENPKERIWFFGGSTMENMIACPDGQTLANQTVKRLNEAGNPTQGFNFGCRAFSSPLESVKFQDLLRRVPRASHPTIVVFYDGYNDSVQSFAGNPGGISRAGPLRLMVQRKNASLIFYSLAGLCGNYSKFCGRYLSPYLKRWLAHDRKQRDRSRPSPEECAALFVRNVRMTGAVAQEFGGQPYFFLQPLVVTKQGLGESEQDALAEQTPEKIEFVRSYYEAIRLGLEDNPSFADLSSALNNNGRIDFFDYGHVAPSTNELIAQAMADRLMKDLVNKTDNES